MFKEKMKGFLAGVCVTALLTGAAAVFAQSIDVAMGGIKVYWDGVEQTLRDAQGDKVEPLIYEGTTYVPLRAMAKLLGKSVDWNQSTKSVYIGGKPVESIPLDKLDSSKINKKNIDIYTGTDAIFNLKDKKIECSNLLKWGGGTSSSAYNLYVLDGDYSNLVAKAVMPYTEIGSDRETSIIFYSVENDGTENEITRYELKQTQNPVDVDVDLVGVTNLKIEFKGITSTYERVGWKNSFLVERGIYDNVYYPAALYNINLLQN